ncbi:hypothetical protein THIOM_005003 [Candidatus Thiomargarita nelsonii]|uniref:Uncharacterized protein n=1 Tax=Candidatus Thiomargarita nelsonii TaxID=1003181 RepID=A0A0A6P1P4_9GAMM|nr:hypothetical protein THIOM_005003 [Candidatus Thiomargarita nelsonii]
MYSIRHYEIGRKVVTYIAKFNHYRSYRFNGIDDYIEIPDDASLDVDFLTMAAWVYRAGNLVSLYQVHLALLRFLRWKCNNNLFLLLLI